MLNSIKDQIEILVKLQDIESEIRNIQSIMNRIPDKLQSMDNELTTAETCLKEEVSRSETLSKKYRDQEREVQLNLSKIKKSEIKLLSIKNQKEYLSALKEIEDLKRINSDIEDEMIAYLDIVDEIDRSIADKKSALDTLTKEIRDEKETIQRDMGAYQKQLLSLEKNKDEISRSAAPELMDKFNLIKKKNSGGVAVVPVTNAVCNGCNVNIPPQMYNELQRFDSLRFCPNCQRIIYWQKDVKSG